MCHGLGRGGLKTAIACQVTAGVCHQRQRSLFLRLGLRNLGQRLAALGHGLLQLCMLRPRVDIHQWLAGAHALIIIDTDGQDLAGDLGRNMDDVRIDECIIGIFILAGDEPPGDAARDQQQHDCNKCEFYPAFGKQRLAVRFPVPLSRLLAAGISAVRFMIRCAGLFRPTVECVPGKMGPLAIALWSHYICRK